MPQEKNKITTKELVWTFTSGCMSRIVELPVGHSLERVRVHINAIPHIPTNAQQATKQIFSAGGLRNVYKGFSWNVLSATCKTGTRWVNIKISDAIVSNVIPQENKAARAVSIGFFSSAITTTIYCPMEVLKVKAMTFRGKKPSGVFSGLLTDRAGRTLILELMRGWRPMFVKEASISVTFNFFYSQFLQMGKALREQPLETQHLAVVGALSGAMCATFTTPLDLLKDQMQIHEGMKERGLFAAARMLYQQHGIRPFIRTMPVKMARSSWYFGMTTMAMDFFNALPAFMRDEKRKVTKKDVELLTEESSTKKPQR